jgi:hypothetical protein
MNLVFCSLQFNEKAMDEQMWRCFHGVLFFAIQRKRELFLLRHIESGSGSSMAFSELAFLTFDPF